MLKLSSIDEVISKYYDDEMNESEWLSFEAKIANSDYIKEYTYQKCDEFYVISNSIKHVKKRVYNYSSLLCDELINKNSKKLFFDFNSVGLKGIYEKLRRLPLNILRNNS